MRIETAKKDRISLIFYENPRSPRYFEINKKHLKFLFVGLPIICLIIISILLLGAFYFNQIKASIMRKEPQIIKDLRVQNQELTEKQKETQEFNLVLQDKLNIKSSTNLSSLSMFYPISGQQDLTHNPLIGIENFNHQIDGTTLSISFTMENLTRDGKKLAGYIFAFLKTDSGIIVYPQSALPEDEFQIKFNRGEYFAFSRFRPVITSFNLNQKTENFLLKVLIFSRTGDLMLKKMFLKEGTK